MVNVDYSETHRVLHTNFPLPLIHPQQKDADMTENPTDEAVRIEEDSEPAPAADGKQFYIKVTRPDGSYAGWLSHSGPGDWLWLRDQKHMRFEDYFWRGRTFLNPVGTYVGNVRYLGTNGGTGNCQAAWNLWGRASEILWDGQHLIQLNANPAQHLIEKPNSFVWWGTDGTSLNFERVPL
jgi:hypothetical protein